MKKRFLLIFLLLFFAGCSVKTIPVYVALRTPKVKVSDEGFLKEGWGYKELEIYKAGFAPIKITLKNSYICLNSHCMDKEKFIKELSPDYPPDILDKIINGKPLSFIGKIIKLKNGFVQKNDRFYYLVAGNKILFKDKKKKIIIFIKKLKGNG
jgi:hypothetical protein